MLRLPLLLTVGLWVGVYACILLDYLSRWGYWRCREHVTLAGSFRSACWTRCEGCAWAIVRSGIICGVEVLILGIPFCGCVFVGPAIFL